mgnify:CR=1 FL=1
MSTIFSKWKAAVSIKSNNPTYIWLSVGRVIQKSVLKFMNFLGYLSDFFTTMVDLKWSYSLLVFLSVYIVSWLVLSFAYWLIAYFRGQLWSADSTSDQVLNANNPCIESISDKRCFYQVDSYMRAFLFFVETDQTIGYGRRAISHHCHTCIMLDLKSEST